MNLDMSIPTIKELLFEQTKAISIQEGTLRIKR